MKAFIDHPNTTYSQNTYVRDRFDCFLLVALEQDFFHSALLASADTSGQIILCCRGCPGHHRCTAASRASTQQMPVGSPTSQVPPQIKITRNVSTQMYLGGGKTTYYSRPGPCLLFPGVLRPVGETDIYHRIPNTVQLIRFTFLSYSYNKY